ncbi:MAG: YggN family protein, partial [Shewanella sp.]|nr:YggN family protein [Shewanella sp.]
IALTPLLGDTAGAKIDEMMEGIEARVAKVAYRDGDEYYLGATESTINNVFDDEFEKEIETAVQSSIGSIMMAVGGQLMSSEGGSFEEKLASFEKKMEGIGSQIETQVEAQAADFEQKADVMCENFKSLAILEEKVRNEIPELADYVVAANESEHKNSM